MSFSGFRPKPSLVVLFVATLAAVAGSLPTPAAAAAAIGAKRAVRIAAQDPKVVAERRAHRPLESDAQRDHANWRIDFLSHGRAVAEVLVDGRNGAVRESWTGYQVTWKMARGYPGAFGRAINAPYIWLPLCALFIAGLLDWRRPWRLAHLDLVALLAFGVSHFFFNRGQIGLSVPLAYPPLLYLLGRMLWRGFRSRGGSLSPTAPTWTLVVATVFLVGLRGGLDVVNSGVVDVGYAGVIGAHHVSTGQPIYGHFPANNPTGDTYGPANYYAYVPFEHAMPWSGHWDNLPAAHAAALCFDLLTLAGLVLLGLRIRPGPDGRRLAAVLAFGWVAFPYTAYVLESNSNDALVSALLVWTLVALRRPLVRGALIALAALTKFAPLVLAPLILLRRGPRASRRAVVAVAAFGATAAVVMLPTVLDPGLVTFWKRTVASQLDRSSPFSAWGQAPALGPLRDALVTATVVLSLAVARWPRSKTTGQTAALGAALVIAVQLTLHHWFYLYIPWFFPLVLVAVALAERRPALRPPAPTRAQPSRVLPALPKPESELELVPHGGPS